MPHSTTSSSSASPTTPSLSSKPTPFTSSPSKAMSFWSLQDRPWTCYSTPNPSLPMPHSSSPPVPTPPHPPPSITPLSLASSNTNPQNLCWTRTRSSLFTNRSSPGSMTRIFRSNLMGRFGVWRIQNSQRKYRWGLIGDSFSRWVWGCCRAGRTGLVKAPIIRGFRRRLTMWRSCSQTRLFYKHTFLINLTAFTLLIFRSIRRSNSITQVSKKNLSVILKLKCSIIKNVLVWSNSNWVGTCRHTAEELDGE